MNNDFACALERVAGLDVHKEQVTACVRVTEPDHKVHAHSRVFSTLPQGLTDLRDWLSKFRVTHVAMEGTGVYWMCVFNALESAAFDLTLCNAHHVKQVPGRKTDQSDAAWLAQLLASGLLKKSFVPPVAIRELRELTRARVHQTEDRARVVNTMHRLLERAGLKLCSVVSDLQGKTAIGILTALSRGERDVDRLAELACGSLRDKREQLRAVLSVSLSANTRLLLLQELAQLKLHDQQVAKLDREIARQSEPYRAQIEALRSIGGIEQVAASALVAELGADGSAFADARQVASWAGLAPGQRESAGKAKRTGVREGNVYVKRILVQVAIVLSRMKNHDLGQWLRKKMVVLGFKKAAVATAHKLLVRLWTMWNTGSSYQPPPPKAPSEAQRARRVARKIADLEALGYVVELQPSEQLP